MNAFNHRTGPVLIGALLGLAALSAAADDTELFIATNDPTITGAQPNILFIYDNSGSMDSTVLTQVAWDPNTTFSGCYRADRVYFSTNSTPPNCSSDNYVNASVNRCNAAAGPLNNVGSYSDRMHAVALQQSLVGDPQQQPQPRPRVPGGPWRPRTDRGQQRALRGQRQFGAVGSERQQRAGLE